VREGEEVGGYEQGGGVEARVQGRYQ